jgi:DNA (cytosine-5)-methyltransferase 1
MPEKTKQGYALAQDGDGVYINRPHQKRGVVQRNKIQTIKTSVDDIGVVVGTYQYAKSDNFMKGKDRLQLGKETSDAIQTTPKEGIVYSNLRIRKLTPREALRLMDVSESDIDIITSTVSNTQAYKLAGNSIVVSVLEAIFRNLF